MDENDPLFMRYCHAHYDLLRCLGEVVAAREPETPTYAHTIGERREVRRCLAVLADATLALDMSAAQFVDIVRTMGNDLLAPQRTELARALESPAIALLLFDAGLEYSAAIALARNERSASRATS